MQVSRGIGSSKIPCTGVIADMRKHTAISMRDVRCIKHRKEPL